MKRILVTGGCGFIGANFVRWGLETYPEVGGNQPRRIDVCRQLGQPRGLERRAALSVREGGCRGPHLGHGLGGRGVRRDRRTSRPRTTSTARSMTPRRSCGPIFRDSMPARRRPPRRARPVRSGLDRRGLRRLGPTTRPSPRSTPLAPNSPYAASKAGADLLGPGRLPLRTAWKPSSRACSNNYGPYQFPEKLIPLFVDQRPGRHPPARLWGAAGGSATGSTSPTTAEASTPRPPARAAPARSTTSGAESEQFNIDALRRAVLDGDRRPGDLDPPRHRSPGARPPLCTVGCSRPRPSWAGVQRRPRSRPASPRRWTGIAPTPTGSTGSAREPTALESSAMSRGPRRPLPGAGSRSAAIDRSREGVAVLGRQDQRRRRATGSPGPGHPRRRSLELGPIEIRAFVHKNSRLAGHDEAMGESRRM